MARGGSSPRGVPPAVLAASRPRAALYPHLCATSPGTTPALTSRSSGGAKGMWRRWPWRAWARCVCQTRTSRCRSWQAPRSPRPGRRRQAPAALLTAMGGWSCWGRTARRWRVASRTRPRVKPGTRSAQKRSRVPGSGPIASFPRGWRFSRAGQRGRRAPLAMSGAGRGRRACGSQPPGYSPTTCRPPQPPHLPRLEGLSQRGRGLRWLDWRKGGSGQRRGQGRGG
mmetsp:Transcript_50940/g.163021  ORF Transcript_50940/g.163021 Transcript_50940/m.163021 type:complete len:226 (-) Transcript_50940:217-894(-)